MAEAILIDAFVVIVVGGMGSLGGAVLASFVIGELQSFGVLWFPKFSLALIYMLMALVLILKPEGLLGGKTIMVDRQGGHFRYLLIFGLGALIAMPWVLGGYSLRLLTEAIIFSLYAVSYNLLLGYAGLLSFGHAMFFGVGAFATTVALEHIAGLPLLLAVSMATLFTALVGLVVGILLLRVKGTPFALLTLAFNALFFSIGVKWTSVTGGDDGAIVNVPNIDLGIVSLNTIDGPTVYFITLVIVGSAIAFCWYFTRTAMGQSSAADP